MKSLLKREFLRLWHEKWIIWTVLLLSVFMMLFPDFFLPEAREERKS